MLIVVVVIFLYKNSIITHLFEFGRSSPTGNSDLRHPLGILILNTISGITNIICSHTTGFAGVLDIEYGLQVQSLQVASLCDLGETFNEHTQHVFERPLFYFRATYLL